MRLVPMTNSQKMSAPRLYYKAFVGSQALPVSERRIGNHAECSSIIIVRTGMGRVGGH
jgi:hypothetical protein